MGTFMLSFSKIFKYIWLFIKAYKFAFFSLFLIATGRVFFLNIFTGLTYKNIIDILGNEAFLVDYIT
jgi:hypothetical protein